MSFEGGDASGKSTQARRLVQALAARGTPVVLAREPGSTPLGERLRELLLAGETPPSPRAEALLFAAARAELVERLVRPALAAGVWVVLDRFADSSVAYQGAGLGLGADVVARLNDWATGGLLPDLTFLLDLPVDAADGRTSAADAIAGRGAAFRERVRQAYLELAAREPERVVVLDARKSPDTIEEEIWRRVGRWLEGGRSG